MAIYHLVFIEKTGSKQHFFHFMWGYLMPSLHIIQDLTFKSKETNLFFLSSCGPVMDKQMHEFLCILNVPFEIAPPSIIPQEVITLQVPRWDLYLIYKSQSFSQRISLKIRAYLKNEYKLTANQDRSIKAVVTHLMNQIEDLNPGNKFTHFKGKRILIDRSEQPKFYDQGGPSEKSTYGKSRRALMGVSEFVKTNKDSAIRFEPGI